jgi:hypothetical protein
MVMVKAVMVAMRIAVECCGSSKNLGREVAGSRVVAKAAVKAKAESY